MIVFSGPLILTILEAPCTISYKQRWRYKAIHWVSFSDEHEHLLSVEPLLTESISIHDKTTRPPPDAPESLASLRWVLALHKLHYHTVRLGNNLKRPNPSPRHTLRCCCWNLNAIKVGTVEQINCDLLGKGVKLNIISQIVRWILSVPHFRLKTNNNQQIN